jgi:hypothetical protein
LKSWHGDVQYEIGKEVSLPPSDSPRLCSNTVLHASENPLHALMFADDFINNSLLEVEGEEILREDMKSGFFSLKVLREVPDKEKDMLFGFHYNEFINPINPCDINSDFDEYMWGDFDRWISVLESIRNTDIRTVNDLVVRVIRASDWGFALKNIGLSKFFFGWNSTTIDDIRNSIIPLISKYHDVPDSMFYDDVMKYRDVVWAYTGSHFPKIHHWAYFDDKFGYPFQCAVNLWKKGFIPIQIKGKWKLCHPIKGQPAQIVWEE